MSLGYAYGSVPMPGRVWKDNVSISGAEVGYSPSDEYIVDPNLPGLASNPLEPSGPIVIPAGRFVALGYSSLDTTGRGTGGGYRAGLSTIGRTPITLHDGRTTTPAGMSENEMYRENSNIMNIEPRNNRYKKWFHARVPMVMSINNANGTVYSGDKLTSYFGSTTSTTAIQYQHRGKPVKWLGRQTYVVTGAASSTVALPVAIYPGIVPVVFAAFSGSGGVPNTSAVTYSFNSTTFRWQATFATGTVTEVWYTWGQGPEQIAGEALRIISLTEVIKQDNLAKFVEMAPNDWLNFPPMLQRQPYTQVGGGLDPVSGAAAGTPWEQPSTLAAGVRYRTLNTAINMLRPVIVSIAGTVTDEFGVTTTYTGSGASGWYTLPTGTSNSQAQFFYGKYHSVNWVTGVIELSSNITNLLDIRVQYSYTTGPRDAAVVWGAGLQGLTDGSLLNPGQTYTNQIDAANQTNSDYGAAVTLVPTNPAGAPAHLNYADVVGELRLMVY